jgi:hypothetical protein
MSNNFIPFLLTLPVKLLYRILDNLDQLTILLSLRNVCIRANTIIDTYHRYQVNFTSFLKLDFHHLQRVVHINNELHFLVLYSYTKFYRRPKITMFSSFLIK